MKKILILVLIARCSLLAAQTPVLKITDTTIAYATSITLPVVAETALNNLNILSFQLRLTFNSAILQPQSIITTGTLLNSFGSISYNFDQTNYINIAAAGTSILKGKGILFYIKFNVKQSGYTGVNFSTDGGGLNANNFINEGSMWGTLENGDINIEAKPVISISPNTGLVQTGSELQFSAQNGTGAYSWTLTNSTVASINSTGLLRGVKAGFTKVIATDSKNYIDTSGTVEVRSLTISTPTNLQQYIGETINVPVNVTSLNSLGIISGSFSIGYNTGILIPVEYVSAGTLLASNYQLWFDYNTSQSILNFAFSGTSTLNGSGTLIYIQFKVIGTGGTGLNFSNAIFNENIPAVNSNGSVSGESLPVISVNPNTSMLYDKQTVQFSVTSGTQPYSWSVSNPALASIASTGILTALNGGTVTVSVVDNLGATASSGNISIYDSFITMPDTVAGMNSIFDYPIYIGKIINNTGVFSFQFNLTYNATYLQFIEIVNTNTLGENWSYVDNPSTGLIQVAFSGANSFDAGGILAKFRFQLLPAMTNNLTTNLSIANTLVNEGNPFIYINKNGSIKATLVTAFTVSGELTYDNPKAVEGMNDTKVYLLNSSSEILDSVSTDANGNFTILNVFPGTYSLNAKTTLAWGGGNPVDALLIDRYYVKLLKAFGDALMLTAADVNGDGKVNPVDALLVDRRYVRLSSSFKIHDWLFSSAPFTVSNQNVIENF